MTPHFTPAGGWHESIPPADLEAVSARPSASLRGMIAGMGNRKKLEPGLWGGYPMIPKRRPIPLAVKLIWGLCVLEVLSIAYLIVSELGPIVQAVAGATIGSTAILCIVYLLNCRH